MSFGGILFLAGAAFIAFVVLAILSGLKEREKINAMSPEDRNNYVFGSINGALICPHCQNKGAVHVKRASRVETSTGKVGGILKANTKSTVTRLVTQHHCDSCNSTWDI